MPLGWMPVGGDSALACLWQLQPLLCGPVKSLMLLASWPGWGQIWPPRLSSMEEAIWIQLLPGAWVPSWVSTCIPPGTGSLIPPEAAQEGLGASWGF